MSRVAGTRPYAAGGPLAAFIYCVSVELRKVEEQQLHDPPGAFDVMRLLKELPKVPCRASSLRVPAAIRLLTPAAAF